MNERNEHMSMLYDAAKRLPVKGFVSMPESVQYLAKTLMEQQYAVNAQENAQKAQPIREELK